jgi:hypothetical protein
MRNDLTCTETSSPAAAPHRKVARTRALLVLFWLWYAIAASLISYNAKSLPGICPVLLGPVWWLIYLCQKPLQALARSAPGGYTLKFFVLGIIFFDVIMESFAVSFKGDLHPSIVISNALWLGACLGVLLTWWLLAKFRRFSPWQVFFLYGIKGVIVEQNFLIPLGMLRGDFLAGLLGIPFILVVYGVAVAPVFLILQNELPRVERKPGIGFAFLSVVLSAAMFYGCGIAWIKAMEFVFHFEAGG